MKGFTLKDLQSSKCWNLNSHIEEVLSVKPVKKSAKAKKNKTDTTNFEICCNLEKLVYEKEVKFCPTRKWRTDFMFSCEGRRVAVEIEGGVRSNGRHTRAEGFIKDMEKYNTYITMGIQLLRFTTEDIEKKPVTCVDTIKQTLILET